MKKIKIGINGFGRIGRIAARIILESGDLTLSAVNSRAGAASHAYLLKYDSTYGILKNRIEADGEELRIDGMKISVFNKDLPREIPWDESGAEIVIDSTGKFRTEEELEGHLIRGIRAVVLSAPAKDMMKTIVIGVNDETLSEADRIVSNSSCTTNCLATTLKVLHDNFRVVKGFMTTIHAVTDSQNLLDNSHGKEVRLRRSSFQSLIPASTGSARDIGKLFPTLSGKIICSAIRVPLPTVSMISLNALLGKKVSAEGVNRAFEDAARGKLKNILSYADEELVSRDFTGSPFSSVFDPYLTRVSDDFLSISAWYDNEWGYASRLVDLAKLISKKKGLL